VPVEVGGNVLGFLVAIAIVALVLILHMWDQGLLRMYRLGYEPPLSRARSWLRLAEAVAVWFAVAVLASVALMACGGRATKPQGLDNLIGYWRLPGPPGAQVFEVRKVGASFEVGSNGGSLVPVRQVSGRLLLANGRVLSKDASVPQVDMAWEANHAVMLLVDTTTKGSPPQKTLLVRLTKTGFAKAVVAYADEMTKEWSGYLAANAGRWAKRHGGTPPPPLAMVPGSPFGKFVVKKGGYGWPFNPFTRRPMHVGTGSGDFTYITTGSSFKLIGHLSGGKDYAAP
jgi:hypothetical protein